MDLELTVLRVFCGAGGSGGNPLGVVLDGAAVPADDRQALAAHFGYNETVFVEDAAAGRIRIYTPAVELPFAGHPVVGTGWLLAREGRTAEALLTPAGKVALCHEPELTWATGRPEWCPEFEFIELAGADEVEARAPATEGSSYVWSWIDEGAGRIRARSFAPEVGIAEDEATGSAALRLCSALDREIEIRQGRGSVIHARPLAGGEVEIGGRVVDADA